MTKDVATIREVYTLIEKMRDEQVEMENRITKRLDESMKNHCVWAEGVVKDAYKIADLHDNRIDKMENWQSSLNGKIAVVGGIIMFVMSIVSAFIVKSIEQVFAKG